MKKKQINSHWCVAISRPKFCKFEIWNLPEKKKIDLPTTRDFLPRRNAITIYFRFLVEHLAVQWFSVSTYRLTDWLIDWLLLRPLFPFCFLPKVDAPFINFFFSFNCLQWIMAVEYFLKRIICRMRRILFLPPPVSLSPLLLSFKWLSIRLRPVINPLFFSLFTSRNNAIQNEIINSVNSGTIK